MCSKQEIKCVFFLCSIIVSLLEQGVNAEALALVVNELRREAAALKVIAMYSINCVLCGCAVFVCVCVRASLALCERVCVFARVYVWV